MTLSQRIGIVEINTLWLFRYLQLAKKRTKVVSFHRLSGTGMTSLIHLSPLLKCLMTVCPSLLHSCVQGTNFSPIRTPGEIMSFGVSPVNYSDSDSAKTRKALNSFAVTANLICAFVFAYADCWLSHAEARFQLGGSSVILGALGVILNFHSIFRRNSSMQTK